MKTKNLISIPNTEQSWLAMALAIPCYLIVLIGGPAGVFLFNVSRRPLFYLVATSRTSVFNFLYPDHNYFFTALGGTELSH